MHAHRRRSVARYALLVLLLAGGTGVDGAPLKVCKQICGQSVQVDCLGLRKGKLKKCRKRIWKACKRGETDCQVVTSTTSTTSTTTLPSAPPTTSTTATTTTTTLPPDDIAFAGTWALHPTLISDTCGSPSDADDVLEVHGSATRATGTLDNIPGVMLTGQIDEDGDLLLSAEIPGTPAECVIELTLRLAGPLDVSDVATTGDATLTHRCGATEQCRTTFSCSFQRAPGS